MAKDEITEETRVPVKAVWALVVTMVSGIVGVGGIVLSFRVDMALVTERTGTMAEKLNEIAESVDGIQDLRTKVDVMDVRLSNVERSLEKSGAR